MSEILEIVMIVSFGFSWPLNLIKALRAKSAKGTSIVFLTLIFIGYIAGIVSKFLNQDYMAHFTEKWYVLIFYFLNLAMVGLNIIVYRRNRRLDKEKEAAEKAKKTGEAAK